MSVARGTSGAAPSAGVLGGALGDVLDALLADRSLSAPVVVLDCGGGSGTLAVPLAARGATVTVIDASIDALAILARRAQEAGVSDRVRAVQADVEDLADLVAAASVDLVLLHGVITDRTDGEVVLTAALTAVRPGGYLSVALANAAAGVLARALTGDLDGALIDLSSEASAPDLLWLSELAEAGGLEVVVAQGLGAFSATVPGAVVSAAHRADETLDRLDLLAATRFPFRDIAPRLHLLARRPVAQV